MISWGMLSTRSMMAAARGSVALASTFSSSVRVIVLRIRISSISVASNRSPGLSGAICGQSYRVMGEESITSSRARSPIITGKVCMLVQASAAGFAHSGGSSREMNRPARSGDRPRRVWQATSEWLIASLRASGSPS